MSSTSNRIIRALPRGALSAALALALAHCGDGETTPAEPDAADALDAMELPGDAATDDVDATDADVDAGPSLPFEDIHWESMNGPYGANHSYFAQDPFRPTDVYLGTARSLYGSRDRGDHWEHLLDGETAAVAFSRDRGFVCAGGLLGVIWGTPVADEDGAEPCGLIYATADQLYVTRPRDPSQATGPHVVLRRSGANGELFTFTDIAPSDAEMSAVLSEYQTETYSMDVGQLFETEAGLLIKIDVREGEGDPVETALLWSEDDGGSWSPATLSLPDPLAPFRLAQSPDDPDQLAMIVLDLQGGDARAFRPLSELVYDSFDGGQTWSQATTVVDRQTPAIGDVDIIDGAYVLTDVDRAIVALEAPDHDSWVEWPRPSVPGYAEFYELERLIVDIESSDVIWGRGRLGWDGVIRSSDGGRTWERTMEGVAAAPTPNLAVHPTDPDVVVACGNLGFLPHITRDFGQSWQPLGGTFLMADEVAFDPHDPSHMLMVSELTDIAESNDGGESWEVVTPHFTAVRVYDFAVSTADEGRIYVSNLGNNISVLAQANSILELPEINWTNMLQSPDYAYDVEVDPSDPDILYATYSPKIFETRASVYRYDATQSDNQGWTEVLTLQGATGVTSVAVDPSDTQTVYAGATGERGRLYVSHDRGESWDPFGDDSGFTFSTVHEVAVDPFDDRRVWAAPWGGGLFESTDGGATWVEHEVPTRSIVTVLPAGDVLLIADRTQPVIWESGDGGATWTAIIRLDGERFTRIMSMAQHNGALFFSALERSGSTPPALRGVILRADEEGVTEYPDELPGPVLRFASHSSGLYAVTHIRGVYRLEQGVWTDLSEGLPDMGFFDVMVDDQQNLWVAGGSDLDRTLQHRIGDAAVVRQIYRSPDGGETWVPVLEGSPFGSPIKRLIQLPEHPDVLVAAAGTGLYVSPNRGASWSHRPGLGFSSLGALALSSGRVYAGTLGGGVYGGTINEVGAVSWSASAGPYPEIHNVQVLVSPADSDVVYVTAFPGGVFRTLDGGQTFHESNFALPSFDVVDPVLQGYYSLAVDPTAPNRVYLGIYEHGVFRSDDGAATWMPLYGTPEVAHAGIRRLAVDPTDTGRLVLATDGGVWVSDNGAETWAPMNDGLDTRDILSVHVDDTGRVFVGTAGYDVYLFDDELAAFTHLGDTVGIGEWHVWERRLYQYSSILFAPDEPDALYLGHFPSGFYISHDGGESWMSQVLGLGNDGIFSLAVHPDDPDVLFAGTYNGVVRSDDRGRTWRQTSQGMPAEQWPFAVVIDDVDPRVMYATTKNGQNHGFCDRNEFCGVLMKSTDGGESWFRIMNGLGDDREFYMLTIHPADRDVLFVSTSLGVFASDDAGQSWVPMNEGLPTLWHRIRDNVARNMWLTADNRHLVLGVVDYSVWQADLSLLGL